MKTGFTGGPHVGLGSRRRGAGPVAAALRRAAARAAGLRPVPACLAAMVAAASAAAAAPSTALKPDSNTFMPVAVRCPDQNGGVFEVISQDTSGAAERLRLVYDRGEPVRVLVAYAFFGTFEESYVIDIAALADDGDEDGAAVASYASDVEASACLADPDQRQQTQREFERNRLMLAAPE
ncbi:hypothetical protein [Ancylobacter lacus]|uniref:hypothetical protein n=1 Tax=Ancylobacter lacus TaxID=2579970 RepID=UPI001BCBCC06|nr:hypothetical protein [Ancylobacter lacus]MBS7540314.1 hypothetical protein [Ancylobacter lacus]